MKAKKVFSFLLALVMVLSLCLTAAAQRTDVTVITLKDIKTNETINQNLFALH